MKPDERIYKAYLGGWGVRLRNTSLGEEAGGMVRTEHGHVRVYSSWHWSETNKKQFELTLVEFIRDGKEYSRRWSVFYRPRYLVTLAKRLAEDVVEGRFEG